MVRRPGRVTYYPWEFIVFFLTILLALLMNRGIIPFDLRLRARVIPATITVATKQTSNPIPMAFYHAFTQGGEEPEDMLKPVIEPLKNLHPVLIRLDHLYDHYSVVSRDSNGGLLFDWSRLDGAVDTIRTTGATPVLSLSYMPSVIAKDGTITNPPDNWNEWATVVQKTIEHYSGRQQKNIANIFYEVWNEPDLVQFGKWSLNGDKNYLTLYQYAVMGAEQAKAVQPFFIGGPATTGLYRNWIVALAKRGYRIDFVSWHTYAADPTVYQKNMHDVREWLAEFPWMNNVQTLVTEFGFTGEKDPRYKTSFAAAYTASVIRHLIDAPPTSLFTFEIKDGPQDTDGNGWGLVTHQTNGGQLAPRYHVFSFLDAMVGNRITLAGEGSRIYGYATRDRDVIRALLYNFDPDTEGGESFPIAFTDLDNGSYHVRQRYFQGSDTTLTVPTTGTTLALRLYLPASGIVLVELSKAQ